ncbi:GntR family transcriptional regulator [Streptomyces sp. NPDC058297]|uniref:GntR family transcriptional regulator n=1 Tax=unclassified Streptomyces TaxID=2593676 RepID=UPI0036ECF61E
MVATVDNFDDFFAQPLTVPLGQPRRVAVYSRLAAGIRAQVFPLGSLLPKESDLGTRLGVSRTVVREALMLLEEDGLIHTRRGVGRFVAPELPRAGLERLRPFEEVLASQGKTVGVENLQATIQHATDFVAGGLKLDPDANTWFWETRLTRDGEPVALVQEHIPAGRDLRDISPLLAERLRDAQDPGRTLFAVMTDILGPVFGPGECAMTAGVAGATRGRLLSLAPSAPLLILTQTAQHGGRAAYLAKYIVRAGERLSINQPPQS